MAFIVDDILLLPVKGPAWLCKKLYEVGETELTDTGALQEQLLELQMRFELDELTEEEYQEEEAKILAKLEAIRKYKEKHKVHKVEGYQGTLH
ncbi:MAG: gas vesicle protein GvpG [Dehalococcoidales bacterium]|nr:gas vesicle protein GvpG [Dehalococcoidales bacterium]